MNMQGSLLANNSEKNPRAKADYYPTPPEVTHALIDTGLVPDGIWECACGEGHMSEVFIKRGFHCISSDIRDTGYGEVKDFLAEPPAYNVSAIVTNPPFKLAAEFIRRAHALDVDVVAMLLKSQYWHAQSRASLFEEFPPSHVLALTWRPDFCFGQRGGAPTMECLWTVWTKGDTETKYRVLRKPQR